MEMCNKCKNQVSSDIASITMGCSFDVFCPDCSKDNAKKEDPNWINFFNASLAAYGIKLTAPVKIFH